MTSESLAIALAVHDCSALQGQKSTVSFKIGAYSAESEPVDTIPTDNGRTCTYNFVTKIENIPLTEDFINQLASVPVVFQFNEYFEPLNKKDAKGAKPAAPAKPVSKGVGAPFPASGEPLQPASQTTAELLADWQKKVIGTVEVPLQAFIANCGFTNLDTDRIPIRPLPTPVDPTPASKGAKKPEKKPTTSVPDEIIDESTLPTTHIRIEFSQPLCELIDLRKWNAITIAVGGLFGLPSVWESRMQDNTPHNQLGTLFSLAFPLPFTRRDALAISNTFDAGQSTIETTTQTGSNPTNTDPIPSVLYAEAGKFVPPVSKLIQQIQEQQDLLAQEQAARLTQEHANEEAEPNANELSQMINTSFVMPPEALALPVSSASGQDAAGDSPSVWNIPEEGIPPISLLGEDDINFPIQHLHYASSEWRRPHVCFSGDLQPITKPTQGIPQTVLPHSSPLLGEESTIPLLLPTVDDLNSEKLSNQAQGEGEESNLTSSLPTTFTNNNSLTKSQKQSLGLPFFTPQDFPSPTDILDLFADAQPPFPQLIVSTPGHEPAIYRRILSPESVEHLKVYCTEKQKLPPQQQSSVVYETDKAILQSVISQQSQSQIDDKAKNVQQATPTATVQPLSVMVGLDNPVLPPPSSLPLFVERTAQIDNPSQPPQYRHSAAAFIPMEKLVVPGTTSFCVRAPLFDMNNQGQILDPKTQPPPSVDPAVAGKAAPAKVVKGGKGQDAGKDFDDGIGGDLAIGLSKGFVVIGICLERALFGAECDPNVENPQDRKPTAQTRILTPPEVIPSAHYSDSANIDLDNTDISSIPTQLAAAALKEEKHHRDTKQSFPALSIPSLSSLSNAILTAIVTIAQTANSSHQNTSKPQSIIIDDAPTQRSLLSMSEENTEATRLLNTLKENRILPSLQAQLEYALLHFIRETRSKQHQNGKPDAVPVSPSQISHSDFTPGEMDPNCVDFAGTLSTEVTESLNILIDSIKHFLSPSDSQASIDGKDQYPVKRRVSAPNAITDKNRTRETEKASTDSSSDTFGTKLLSSVVASFISTSSEYLLSTYPTLLPTPHLLSLFDEAKIHTPASALSYLDTLLAIQPQNARLWHQRGVFLLQHRDTFRAEECFHRALTYVGDISAARSSAGDLDKDGKVQKGQDRRRESPYFDSSLNITSGAPNEMLSAALPLLSLGCIKASNFRTVSEAESFFTNVVVEHERKNAFCWAILGVYYSITGKDDEAKHSFQMTQQLKQANTQPSANPRHVGQGLGEPGKMKRGLSTVGRVPSSPGQSFNQPLDDGKLNLNLDKLDNRGQDDKATGICGVGYDKPQFNRFTIPVLSQPLTTTSLGHDPFCLELAQFVFEQCGSIDMAERIVEMDLNRTGLSSFISPPPAQTNKPVQLRIQLQINTGDGLAPFDSSIFEDNPTQIGSATPISHDPFANPFSGGANATQEAFNSASTSDSFAYPTAPGLVWMARLALERRDFGRADRLLTKASECQKDFGDADRWRSHCLYDQGEIEAALPIYKKLTETPHVDPLVSFRYGSILFSKSRVVEAKSFFALSCSIWPTSTAFAQLAMCALSLGDENETEKMLNVAARYNPNSADVNAILAIVELRKEFPQDIEKTVFRSINDGNPNINLLAILLQTLQEKEMTDLQEMVQAKIESMSQE
ncbi:hypothetical protein BLNAU_12246 [Blattamonas nauphoetae]|uniref:Uncharacterized protein n=1 Tax=Blattamonas nauphoetae TaxID=2049346 RepID=A0ABQ9XK25_9EUKA|nr:hypothetical protein BLNAU_12246 [Blattamonas nauphoetae]